MASILSLRVIRSVAIVLVSASALVAVCVTLHLLYRSSQGDPFAKLKDELTLLGITVSLLGTMFTQMWRTKEESLERTWRYSSGWDATVGKQRRYLERAFDRRYYTTPITRADLRSALNAAMITMSAATKAIADAPQSAAERLLERFGSLAPNDPGFALHRAIVEHLNWCDELANLYEEQAIDRAVVDQLLRPAICDLCEFVCVPATMIALDIARQSNTSDLSQPTDDIALDEQTALRTAWPKLMWLLEHWKFQCQDADRIRRQRRTQPINTL